MYGRLWSAVSFVSGFHFSGSLPSIVWPASCEAISTETISSVFSISFLASRAAQMDVWEWISAGKNFRYVSAILNDPFFSSEVVNVHLEGSRDLVEESHLTFEDWRGTSH